MLEKLRELFVDELTEALEQRGEATSLLLSGGSTPLPLYRELADSDLDWQRVNVALVDERWVATDNEASNEYLIRQKLLTGHARLNARFHRHEKQVSDRNQWRCRKRSEYRDLPLPQPYDICLLGMGPDGHTASLFPGSIGLEAALRREVHCAPIEAQASERHRQQSGRAYDHDALESAAKRAQTAVVDHRGRQVGSARTSSPVRRQQRHYRSACSSTRKHVDLEVYWAP